MRFFLFTSFFLFFCLDLFSQNQYHRATYNNVAWFTYSGTYKLFNKWDLVTDVAHRRSEWGAQAAQTVLRATAQYHLSAKTAVAGGYAYIMNYPNGDLSVPLNSAFKANQMFPEHRTHQQISVKDNIGALNLTHRVRLEQRWVGAIDTLNKTVKNWNYTNRIRYFIRLDFPLAGKTIDDNELYVAAHNEIFINFGENVKFNVFDQNRIGILLGYKLNTHLKAEFGVLQQILQQRDLVNNQTVFQYNHGYFANLNYNLSCLKTATK
jgi:hypothetical protein